jgi:hypothetical protein
MQKKIQKKLEKTPKKKKNNETVTRERKADNYFLF